MSKEAAEEMLKQEFLKQWQDGMVTGREMISMSFNKIKTMTPDTHLSISQVIDIVEDCKFPFELKN